MNWSLTNKPHLIMQNVVMGQAHISQERLGDILQAGGNELFEIVFDAARRNKRVDANELKEESEFYEISEVKSTLRKKLANLRKLTFADFINETKPAKADKYRLQFRACCRMLHEGLALQSDLDEKTVAAIQGELKGCIADMLRLEHELKSRNRPEPDRAQPTYSAPHKDDEMNVPIENDKEAGLLMPKLEIATLREVVADYLGEMSVDPGEDAWDKLYDDPDYEAYLAVRNKTYVRLFAEQEGVPPVLFLLFAAPLENRHFVIWMGAYDDDVTVRAYDELREALGCIIEFLNENKEYTLDPRVAEFTVTYELNNQLDHEVTYVNDNRLTLAQKFERLLQLSSS